MGRLIVLAALLLAMATSATTAAAQAPRAWKPATAAGAKPLRALLPGNSCVQACEASYEDAAGSCNTIYDPTSNCAPDDAACIADFTALRAGCLSDANTARQNCIALCPPPTCSELCEQTYQDALANCAATYAGCIAGAGGDPDLTAVCDAQHAVCLANADAAHVACLAACGPTPNRRHTWGQVKAIYR
jgi:hypothetical protein